MRGGIRSDIYALHGYNKRREPASATSATDGQFLYYTTRSPPGFHHQRQPLCRLFCFTAAVVLVVAALISLYLVKRYSNCVGKAPATCSGYPSWLSQLRVRRRCFTSSDQQHAFALFVKPASESAFSPLLGEIHAEKTLQRPIGIPYLL